MEVVIRASESDALRDYAVVEARHGIADRVGSDGSPRGLNVGRPAARSSRTTSAGSRHSASREVIWIFRDPFDLETIARLGEVRPSAEAAPSGSPEREPAARPPSTVRAFDDERGVG